MQVCGCYALVSPDLDRVPVCSVIIWTVNLLSRIILRHLTYPLSLKNPSFVVPQNRSYDQCIYERIWYDIITTEMQDSEQVQRPSSRT